MTIHFTSDTHFGHRKMMEYRGYASIDDMNHDLIVNWNAAVSARDTIYHLGDLSFFGAGTTKEIVRQLNGEIHLIPGNHDKPFLRRSELVGMFKTVEPLKEIKVPDDDLGLEHALQSSAEIANFIIENAEVIRDVLNSGVPAKRTGRKPKGIPLN